MNTPGPQDILIVDDDPDLAHWLAVKARKHGLRLHMAASAEDLMERLTTVDPALIVVDLGLPDSDGIAVLRELHAREVSAPIVLISSSDNRVLKAARSVGASLGLLMSPTVMKPLTEEVLLNLIAEIPPLHPVLSRADLTRAIADAELEVYFQPKIDTDSHAIIGAEALARWRHPKEGLLHPDRFLTLAEQPPVAEALTRFVLETALAACAAWPAPYAGHAPTVAVNIPAHCASAAQFPGMVQTALARHRLAPERLILEITETAAVGEEILCTEVLARLRILGVGISIDDFGTGYSSLRQLQRLPFSELKIDRSFVWELEHDEDAKTLTRLVIAMADALGVDAVAEGVESEAQKRFLSAHGCPVQQGYLFSRPVPARDFDALLRDRIGQCAPILTQ